MRVNLKRLLRSTKCVFAAKRWLPCFSKHLLTTIESQSCLQIPHKSWLKCGVAWNKSAQPQLNQTLIGPLSREASRQPRRSARNLPGTNRLDTCPYPTPKIVQKSSRSPAAYLQRTGLEQGLSVRPLRATVPRQARMHARRGAHGAHTPRREHRPVTWPRRGRDPRPDLRKTPSKKPAAKSAPRRGRPTAHAGRVGDRCAVRWGPGGTGGSCGHRWAEAGPEDTSARLERVPVTQVGSEDTRGWPGGVSGTQEHVQVRVRAQVAGLPAAPATKLPWTPPGRQGAARGDKDERP